MPPRRVEIDRLLNLDTVCERLGGIGRSTLYALAAEGHLPLCKLGSRLTRVREADLAAFIARIPEGRSASPNPRATTRRTGTETKTAASDTTRPRRIEETSRGLDPST